MSESQQPSAETLRRAARAIRSTAPWAFHLAVADWLDALASHAERDEWSNTYDQALAVARTFLAEKGEA